MDTSFSGDEEPPPVNSSLWRTGAASYFFDQMGIPEDGNIDYESVYHWINLISRAYQERLEEDAESESSDDPNYRYRKMINLELKKALQSIEEVIKCNRMDDNPEPFVDTYSNSNDINGEIATNGEIVIESSEMAYQWVNLNEKTEKQRQDEMEVTTAVEALLEEMKKYRRPPPMEILPSPEEMACVPREGHPESMLEQVEWEKAVIWNAKDVKNATDSKVAKAKLDYAGWIPTMTKRKFTGEESEALKGEESVEEFSSLFPVDNDILVRGEWEQEIIWNVDDFLRQCPHPKVTQIDFSDEHIVYEKPKDVPKHSGSASTNASNSPTKPTTNIISPKKVMQPHAFKSKLLLGKAGFIHWKWQMEQELKAKEQAAQLERERNKNKATSASSSEVCIRGAEVNFNLSNDEFYQPQSKEPVGSDMLSKMNSLNYIRHSKVVLDLLPPYMPTYLSEDELKNFHRPQLRDHPQAPRFPNRYTFMSCHPLKVKKAKERDLEIKDGHQVLLDRPSDLTGVDGEMVLVENSEEYPPLMNQVGMCSKIINYYKRKSMKDRSAHGVPHPYGETTFVYQTFPFLGNLEPGQVLSALVNNMYRAPIYRHSNPSTDFIVIFNKSGNYIREFDTIFTSGQQCPLIEVPEPNSPRARLFSKNMVLVYVYRKFSKFPPGSTARIKLTDLYKSFPGLFESTLKTWLKTCAEVKKIGTISWVVMKDGFVIPEENELKELVTPEQCCAYYSLLAAEQRLKEAGCDSLLSLPERPEGAAETGSDNVSDAKRSYDINEQINQSKLMEELKAAPWNTTSAFVAASKGKCFLQVTGPADPTGRGEGFSYIRVGKKGPQPGSQEQRKRQQLLNKDKSLSVNFRPGGTDADLRKLSSKHAKELLRKAGLPDKEISKLQRWELIDVVRTLSTERARQGERDDKGIAKFSRWKSKTNSLMNLERYKEDCQRVFELQNKVLSSAEPLTTDDEEEDEDNQVNAPTQEDIHEMGQNLERILREGKTASQLAHEEEELERLELQKMMLGGIQAKDAEIAKKAQMMKRINSDQKKKDDDDLLTDLINNPGRKLKISRTFKDNGKTFLRTEIVRDPVVIAAYLKIRTTKSEEFIKDFLQKADRQQKKEEKIKEKLLLTELSETRTFQHTVVERLQRKRKREMEAEYFPNKTAKSKAKISLWRQTRKCGACGMLGHTKSSPRCPMHNPEKLQKDQQKTQKRGRGRPPINRDGKKGPLAVLGPVPSSSGGAPYPQVPKTVKPLILKEASKSKRKEVGGPGGESTSENEDGSKKDSSSSSSESSSEDDDDDVNGGDEETDSSDSSSEELVEDQSMVKVDGLKMVLRVPQDMVTRAQIEEQEEEEAARILLSMSNASFGLGGGGGTGSGVAGLAGSIAGGGGGPPKRRSSQAEREYADYLNDRKYKTTAADRIRKKV